MSVNIYTNDEGSLVLTPRDMSKAARFAEGVQAHLWGFYGDELIGVPEAELYCNRTSLEWDERIRASRAKTRWREYCQ